MCMNLRCTSPVMCYVCHSGCPTVHFMNMQRVQ